MERGVGAWNWLQHNQEKSFTNWGPERARAALERKTVRKMRKNYEHEKKIIILFNSAPSGSL